MLDCSRFFQMGHVDLSILIQFNFYCAFRQPIQRGHATVESVTRINKSSVDYYAFVM